MPGSWNPGLMALKVPQAGLSGGFTERPRVLLTWKRRGRAGMQVMVSS